ncbi:hypothetical protein TFLX_06717 [Thermoflexales bacterium]|nr:hypothetical protein TFLX_06717 [Thermoflexales bacterium]
MHEVSDALVANWSINNRVRLPSAVDLVCPHCGRKITFSLHWSGISDTLMSTTSRCPACSKSSVFVLVDFQALEASGDKKGRLFIYPAPNVRSPIEGITEVVDFSTELQRAYSSAVNVYNVQEWNAAAVLCRRLLEGIALSLVPEEKRRGSLYQQLQALPEYRDLKAPIMTLADAIRKGGNLGAHFDLEKEPNEETVA